MARAAPALAGLLLIATPATADVTPREVWEDWTASLSQGDAEMSTEDVQEGEGRLTVRGLSVSSGTAEEGRYQVEIDEITLVQNDDGTVGVRVSPTYPVVLTDTDEEGPLRETRLSVHHPGLEMTVTDEGGQRVHAFAAPEVRVTVEEVQENGEPIDLSGALVLTNAQGRYGAGEAADDRSAFSASELQATFGGTDPDSGERFDLTLGMEGLDSRNMLQLLGPDAAASVREMPEGASIDGAFTTSGSSFTLNTEREGETVTLAGTTGPSTAEVQLSPEGMSYASDGVDTTLAISGSTIPLPQVTIEIGRASSRLAVPMLASDEPQPYALSVSMLDVVLDEGLWNMVDPAGILPRDPGSVVVDVSGDVSVEQDMGAAGVADAVSGEVETVGINTVRLEMADAEVVASGLLRLQEAADETVPVGEVRMTISGADQLLERLVLAGILPQEQATGARMMLAMFATPGEGEDELVSRIQFTEDGRIFVNDQPVR